MYEVFRGLGTWGWTDAVGSALACFVLCTSYLVWDQHGKPIHKRFGCFGIWGRLVDGGGVSAR